MSAEVWAAIIAALGTVVAAVIVNERRKGGTVGDNQELKTCRFFGAREKVDAAIALDERIKLGLGIKEIRVLNFASSSLLSPDMVDYIGLPSRSELSDRIEKLVCEENIKLTLIINSPECEAADEALSSSKIVNLNTDCQSRRQVFYQAYAGIQKRIREDGVFYESYCKGSFKYRITTVSLPYAIFQVKYEDSRKDHVKIDMYSPYISRESKRRTFYIYKEDDVENYEFFEQNFDNVFKYAIAETEERQHSQVWLNKADEFNARNKRRVCQ